MKVICCFFILSLTYPLWAISYLYVLLSLITMGVEGKIAFRTPPLKFLRFVQISKSSFFQIRIQVILLILASLVLFIINRI